MSFTRPQYLVETDWLAAHLEDLGLRVLECTVFLHPAPDAPGGVRVESGRAKWAEGHIPGAGFIDLQEELSDRTSKLLGRDDIAVYDASLSEWANDPTLPMERG